VISVHENEPITRYRKEIRAGLLSLGLPLVAIGAWALIGPHSFYENFPASGRHWVSGLGPYDEHLVRDVGSLLMAIGLLQTWAAAQPSRLLVRAALVVGLVYAVPHLIFHASNTEPFSTGDNVVNIGALVLAVVVPILLLVLTRATGTVAAASDREAAIEREATYGTR
jgi:hypothetical protein